MLILRLVTIALCLTAPLWQVAALNRQLAAETVLPGDVLRAVTCTNFVYPTKALFGAAAPERHIVSLRPGATAVC